MDLLTKFFRSVMSDKTNLIELFQHNRPSLQDVEYALSQGADVNAVNSEGAPVLALAAQTKNPDIITLLIEAGADPNTCFFDGMTPFFSALKPDCAPEIITAFINGGADVNSLLGDSERTPLHIAVWLSNQKVASVLIKAGADIDARDCQGMTPLIFACQVGFKPEMITILLKAGADPSLTCYAGKTAFDYVQQNESLVDTTAFWELKDTASVKPPTNHGILNL